MNKDVYLYELDISYLGQKGLFNKDKLNLYFKSYLLLSNHVFMQASAPMKIKEVYELFVKYKACFQDNDLDDNIALASFVLSKDKNGYTEYLENRLEILNKAHIQPKKNPEYNAYEINNAKQIVKEIDNEIIYSNSTVYRKERTKSADKLFRNQVRFLIEQDIFNENYGVNTTIQKELSEYPTQMELFQTFELNKIIRDLNIENKQQLTQEIRTQYYLANQRAVNANSSLSDSHFEINNILVFYKLIGIIDNVNNIDNAEIIFKIRQNVHFIFLKDLYFKASTEDSLLTLQKALIDGGLYNIIGKSNKILFPLAINFLMNTSKTIFDLIDDTGLIKDNVKDILSEYIGDWKNFIFNSDEYKIRQHIKYLQSDIRKCMKK